eukprot:RCo005085
MSHRTAAHHSEWIGPRSYWLHLFLFLIYSPLGRPHALTIACPFSAFNCLFGHRVPLGNVLRWDNPRAPAFWLCVLCRAALVRPFVLLFYLCKTAVCQGLHRSIHLVFLPPRYIAVEKFIS